MNTEIRLLHALNVLLLLICLYLLVDGANNMHSLRALIKWRWLLYGSFVLSLVAYARRGATD